MGSNRRSRRRVEPTDEWEQIELLCAWPEQRNYELIRPLVLFGSPAPERSSETGAASERTLQRRVARFDAEGMESLFGSEHARCKKLPPAIRRLVVDLKAEYPRFNLNEIANAVYVRFGRRPDHKTVRRILEEEPIPLRFLRRFSPYHEIPERKDGRAAVVALHADGWSALAGAHERFVEDYNAQAHFAHLGRDDGRRSPAEVLGFASGVRHREEELRRAFFTARFVRVLDALGYARFRHWRLYGEEGLAGREAALWLAAESLTVEHAGEPLSRYEVRVEAGTGELRSVARPRLFENSHLRSRPQRRLFPLDELGAAGWLKALKLDEYAPRGPRRPMMQQAALFPFLSGTGG